MLRFFFGLSLSAVLVAGCAQQSQTTENAPLKHVAVHFTDFNLAPSIAHVVAGGSVGWMNYASEYVGVVRFDAAASAGFTCKDVRPDFAKTADGITSIPIPRGGMETVVTPCALRPGAYVYYIDLFERPDDMFNPNQTLTGKIVVQ